MKPEYLNKIRRDAQAGDHNSKVMLKLLSDPDRKMKQAAWLESYRKAVEGK